MNTVIYIVMSYMPSDNFCELQENYGPENQMIIVPFKKKCSLSLMKIENTEN